MTDAVETVNWVCGCGEVRPSPFRFVGPGAPGCPKCGKPMARKGETAPEPREPVVPAFTKGEPKAPLRLLLERIDADPNSVRQKQVLVSEYTWSVAQAALEATAQLRELFGDQPGAKP